MHPPTFPRDSSQESNPALRYSVVHCCFWHSNTVHQASVNHLISQPLGICCNFKCCKQMGVYGNCLTRHCILICGLTIGFGVDQDSKKQMTTASGCGLVLKTRVAICSFTYSLLGTSLFCSMKETIKVFFSVTFLKFIFMFLLFRRTLFLSIVYTFTSA